MEHRYKLLKVYMMVGVPGETDEDVDELVRFTNELARIHPTVLGVAPFVPKKLFSKVRSCGSIEPPGSVSSLWGYPRGS